VHREIIDLQFAKPRKLDAQDFQVTLAGVNHLVNGDLVLV
jgi:hypothetical protein